MEVVSQNKNIIIREPKYLSKDMKRPNKLVDKIIASNTARARKDITSWRVALHQAENALEPKRILLYSLYEELVLDAHLSSEIQKRILSVRGSRFSIYNLKDGSTDNEKTNLLKKPWFYEFIDLAIESIFYGHSLIQIGDLKEHEVSHIKLIDRKHVIPEKGLFVYNQTDTKGIAYREDTKYSPWLLEVGKPTDLGVLNKTAPHVLYKRFSMSAWSEFCELFGMPIRIGKTNVKDLDSLNRMENMMVSMGPGNYLICDDQEKIEFVETAKSNGEVYSNLIGITNAEISKLISGAVIGEASDGGSRSKEEVGERMGDIITLADKQFLEGYINNTLISKLIALGYPLEGYAFRFEKSKDIDSLWKITQGLLQHKDIDNDFITKTFGIPVLDKPTSGDATDTLKLVSTKYGDDSFFG